MVSSTFVFGLAASAMVVVALPSKNNQFIAMPDASRSPCPALNVLANHGYIARDGKNITKDDFNTAVTSVFNVDPAFAASFSNAIFAGIAAEHNGTAPLAVDLADLDAHGFTEHDASLTRFDAIQGDNHSMQPTLLQALLDDVDTSGTLTPTSFGNARVRRQQESIAAGSPPLPRAVRGAAYIESALLLRVLGDMGYNAETQTIAIPIKAAQQFFGDERLPNGYFQPWETVTAKSVQTLADQMYGGGLFQ